MEYKSRERGRERREREIGLDSTASYPGTTHVKAGEDPSSRGHPEGRRRTWDACKVGDERE